MTPPTTTSTVLLKHHLKALKLPTVASECEKVAARCASGNVDHLNEQSQNGLRDCCLAGVCAGLGAIQVCCADIGKDRSLSAALPSGHHGMIAVSVK